MSIYLGISICRQRLDTKRYDPKTKPRTVVPQSPLAGSSRLYSQRTEACQQEEERGRQQAPKEEQGKKRVGSKAFTNMVVKCNAFDFGYLDVGLAALMVANVQEFNKSTYSTHVHFGIQFFPTLLCPIFVHPAWNQVRCFVEALSTTYPGCSENHPTQVNSGNKKGVTSAGLLNLKAFTSSISVGDSSHVYSFIFLPCIFRPGASGLRFETPRPAAWVGLPGKSDWWSNKSWGISFGSKER